VGAALLDVIDVLVGGALDEGGLVLDWVLLEVVGVEVGSATGEDVQPATTRTTTSARPGTIDLRILDRVITPPS
jgi:hypothetical protein